VFTLGRNVNANPKELGVIFAYLDGLTVNAAPNGTAAGEPFATVGLMWKSVRKFVHHLKRELIYAQSEIIIIRYILHKEEGFPSVKKISIWPGPKEKAVAACCGKIAFKLPRVPL
jgi:hypothetical protein